MIDGAGLGFLLVVHLTTWTIVPCRVCGIVQAIRDSSGTSRGGRDSVRHLRISGICCGVGRNFGAGSAGAVVSCVRGGGWSGVTSDHFVDGSVGIGCMKRVSVVNVGVIGGAVKVHCFIQKAVNGQILVNFGQN